MFSRWNLCQRDILWYVGPCSRLSLLTSVSVRLTILGTVILLFFQCMGALLDPINRMRGGIKWALVAHTVAMFSALTSGAAMGLNLDPIVYINNREFPGTTLFAPGPIGYQRLIYSDAISVVPNALAFFNTWLADGFLVSYVPSTSNYPSYPSNSYSSIVAT